MNNKHDYENDPIYVTRKEIMETLQQDGSKKSMVECFDIKPELYDKLKKGLIPAVRLGKHNGVVDIDEELQERKQGLHKCNYPITKCTCEAKEA